VANTIQRVGHPFRPLFLMNSDLAQTPRRVALTGATGFVGRAVLKQLLAQGHHVRALVRDPNRLELEHDQLTPVSGNLFEQASLDSLVEGCDAVIHLVGIIEEFPKRGQRFQKVHVQGTEALCQTAQQAGVKRWVQMSATGTRDNAVSTYHQTKWLAEQAIRSSGLDWTILRPSLVHGPRGDFMRMVKGFATQWFPPFMPYFGAGLVGTKGTGTLQPVYVQDVAACFAGALQLPETIGQTYELVGPDQMTMPELYRVLKKHMGIAGGKPIFPVPVWYARAIAGLPGVPFNRDMVVMSQELSDWDRAPAERDFGLQFQPFEETLARYISELVSAS